MTTLHLPEFKGYATPSLYQYLILQSTTQFRITIPKETSITDPNSIISYEYTTALYIGQKLAELSTCFSYYIPSPIKTGTFIFAPSYVP